MRYWFQYFPENFMWSQGMIIVIEMARWGGSSISEIDRVGQRLKDRVGDNDAWGDEWEKEARRIEDMGKATDTDGRAFTAASHYLRASMYYFTADRFVRPGAKKRALYESCLRCFQRGIAHRYPNIERVEVPYEGTFLPAWFMKAPVKGPAPTVCFFDGLDSSKEPSVLFGGVELANRGMHTLAIDGPGQGEALRLRDMPTRHDYEVPAAAAYDYVASRADVDCQRVAIMAFSMGGYYAPRAAAFEKRFAACVAWGGHYDYQAVWKDRWTVMQAGGTKTSAPHFQLPWVTGTADMDAAIKFLEPFTLEGVAQKIECPFLVTHGEKDTIVPVESARRLYEAVGSKDKSIKIFTEEEGGSEHCQGDNRQFGSNYVADWLAKALRATPPNSLRIV